LKVNEDLFSGEETVLVTLVNQVDERVEATHDACCIDVGKLSVFAFGKYRKARREKTKKRTELHRPQHLPLQRIREPLPNDPTLSLLGLKSREVVEVGLARVLALEDAV